MLQNNRLENLIVSIGGGHGAGCYETSLHLKESILKMFPNSRIRVLNLDDMKDASTLNYDFTDYDFKSLHRELLKQPTEGDTTGKMKEPICINILCGGYALYDKEIRDASKLKVYLDSDADKRLINLIQTQNITQPKDLSVLLTEYLHHLREESLKYIEPTRVYADLIIPCKNESLASAILLDGINKAVEEMKTPLSLGDQETHNPLTKKTSLLNFEAERIDVQKGRYYDLA
ncbi:hypothetical protein TPHA_0M00890 [Tetrapisispora phaffii CBS 4417]|uniref:Phosphoribulokinase/uridine kinase domain-containing protein n=1 Tax=Tetrapisispora phaffii (strain ATCC 24235 / CBS 4417 / NBRC 1672 / NRRL Y-8282 / UCD 70-5) TaxID=1071381 RepID=G8C0E9_TETPH|nr:hypothetical protein TPHA_0M00890 [Tetrapisispora phaffii CBS 4417]CCE65664.1 hypothetical protein TPHA_0M00890 [Tetrapisispora phaffii CBS 4417]